MSNSESELTHASILQEARAARDGIWIEKILAQVRESMCGTGFADQKDIPEKLKTLPNLMHRPRIISGMGARRQQVN